MNAGLEPDGRAAGFQIMFKRKQRPTRPAIHQIDAVPEEDKVFSNTDGSVSMSGSEWPVGGQDDFGGIRLHTPPVSLGTAPQPPDQAAASSSAAGAAAGSGRG